MYAKRLFQFVIAVVIIHTILAKNNGLGDFICTDGSKIDLKNICNGAVDCADGSDETKELCYHVICPKGTFRCHYGACVHQVKRCNGKHECADKSDESQCGRAVGSCEKNEFKCESGQCIHVDHMCDGEEHCAYGSDESKATCEELPCPENTFRCKHGGCVHLDARCNGVSDCIDGSDESEMLCKNLHCKGVACSKLRNKVHCPAIDISRIDAICQSNAGVVPCDNPVPAGTTVEYECKPHFVAVDSKHTYNRRALCQLDGTWNRKLLQCEPKCGDIGPEAVALVVNGWDTGKKLYPWHATMYVEEEGKWEFWCGGTLISEKAVLTAGHCIWKILPKNIKMAFGKYHSDFHKRQPITQIKNVKRIITQPLYQDRTGNYGSDLAVLVLSDAVKLSSDIHPACIDWNARDTSYHLQNNSIGLAVGMGITENDTFSETLRGVYLPVVTNEKCVEDQEEDFKKYITYTVFCAGWKNGTGVCNGDSGGGLLFPKVSDKSKWILQGVVSVSPRKKGTSFCNPKFYTVFTKISIYLNWLKQALQSIHHQYYR